MSNESEDFLGSPLNHKTSFGGRLPNQNFNNQN